jgi:hypothetical protein
MRAAAWSEIEYLGAIEGVTAKDPRVISEMCRRLEALRRFDQNFSDADWKPGRLTWGSGPPHHPFDH